jgi:hypothetical protein
MKAEANDSRVHLWCLHHRDRLHRECDFFLSGRSGLKTPNLIPGSLGIRRFTLATESEDDVDRSDTNLSELIKLS